jgi:transposase-like protein
MSGYSDDLKQRIVSSVDSGMSKAQAARTFSVSPSAVKRYADKASRGESLAPRRPRVRSEAGRQSQEALGGGRQRAPLRHSPRTLRLHGGHDRTLCESLHYVPCYRPDRPHQEKGGRLATERDEFDRAAWREMVAAMVEPERLIFVDECVLGIPPLGPSTATLPGASDCGFRCLASFAGARTLPFFRALPSRGIRIGAALNRRPS